MNIAVRVDKLDEKSYFDENKDETQWFDVGDMSAREKVAQTFRDALHEKYRSSSASKNKKRRLERKAKNAACALSDAYHNNLPSYTASPLMVGHLQKQFLKPNATEHYQTRITHDQTLGGYEENAPISETKTGTESFDVVPKILCVTLCQAEG